MKVNANVSIHSQEDPESGRKIFTPAFPPSSSPELWFVHSLLDSLSDTSPKLLISEKHLKRSRALGPDRVPHPIPPHSSYEK